MEAFGKVIIQLCALTDAVRQGMTEGRRSDHACSRADGGGIYARGCKKTQQRTNGSFLNSRSRGSALPGQQRWAHAARNKTWRPFQQSGEALGTGAAPPARPPVADLG